MEVMFALSFLVVISGTFLPLLAVVYQERLTVEEEVKALEALEAETYHYLTGTAGQKRDPSIRREDTGGGLIKFCSQWTGVNGRDYEKCLYAAR
ncbi:hypothetical protein M3202_14420 [Alkalihalobacillus oceani]|uniref:Uncharacterized protein n=1 Tax=Halalkalibacter oceani TaxID=1653776 RepID=A0A9X2IPI7_9BACI|nr:hypothetical protein [Halalkalibacter oceani]MCM3715280.1 hypothetical protein [Halalkalibacter oceani]